MREHDTTRWWPTVVAQVLLVLALLPILDIFLHPISVLSGDYDPVINWLPEFYMRHGLHALALVAVPVSLAVLGWLLRRTRPHVRLTLFVLPVGIAVLIQYLVAAQLDRYLVLMRQTHDMRWLKYLWQPSFITACLVIVAGFAALCGIVEVVVHLRKGKPEQPTTA